MQNIAVSAKGLLLKNIRKSGQYAIYRKSVVARQNWSNEQFQDYQLKHYQDLVSYAIQHVPYYRRIFGDKGITSNTITCLDDITQLPILKRGIVKNNPTEFHADNLPTKNSISLHTTGTTGSPLKITSDNNARQKNYAFFDGYLETLGLNPDAKHIIIGGRVIVPQKNTKPPFWRYSFFQKSLLMSSYHLNDKFMDTYIDKVESFSPEYIESYPSSIYILAKHILKKQRKIKCKAIITSSETLFPEQRETIEKAFNTTVYDQYGCVEMSLFVGQCRYGRYHVRPDYGLLELVDDDGAPVLAGQPGNVICTGFINDTMPLMRYAIGDIATLSENSSCDCGLNTPILKEIMGRADDILLTSNGQAIGRMSPVLKNFPVKEAQYIQYKAGEVELLIVPDTAFSKERDEKLIIDAVQLRLGKKFSVHLSIVKHIERGKGGKLKAVISKI